MTLILKQIFSLLRLLHSETGTLSIAFGLVLGMYLGLSPILSLQSLFVFVCLFVFRVQLGSAFIATFFFKCCLLGLLPLFHILGEWVLSMTSLRPLWTTLYHMPLLPYTRFNSSIVMGAGLFCFLFSVPAFYLFKWGIKKYRQKVVAFVKNSRLGLFVRGTSVYKWYLKYQQIYGEDGR